MLVIDILRLGANPNTNLKGAYTMLDYLLFILSTDKLSIESKRLLQKAYFDKYYTVK